MKWTKQKNGVINALYVEKLDICQDTNGFIKPPADAHILWSNGGISTLCFIGLTPGNSTVFYMDKGRFSSNVLNMMIFHSYVQKNRTCSPLIIPASILTEKSSERKLYGCSLMFSPKIWHVIGWKTHLHIFRCWAIQKCHRIKDRIHIFILPTCSIFLQFS